MEAGTLHCPSCGAAVGDQDLRCPYCSSQLATVACPKCFAMVGLGADHCSRCGAAIQSLAAGKATATACPDCHCALAATTLGGLGLEQCGKCGGLWVARAAFEKVAADRGERGEVMGALPGPGSAPVRQEAIRYRPCPCCGKFMNRQNYARISGVVLDICKEDGLWFDRDELRQVLAFIEGGGLVRSRDRQLLALEEERRLNAVAAAAPVQGGAWADGDSRSLSGNIGLTSVLESLVQLFLR